MPWFGLGRGVCSVLQPAFFSEHVSLSEEGSGISAYMAKRKSRTGSEPQTDALGDISPALGQQRRLGRAHLRGCRSQRPPAGSDRCGHPGWGILGSVAFPDP